MRLFINPDNVNEIYVNNNVVEGEVIYPHHFEPVGIVQTKFEEGSDIPDWLCDLIWPIAEVEVYKTNAS